MRAKPKWRKSQKRRGKMQMFRVTLAKRRILTFASANLVISNIISANPYNTSKYEKPAGHY